MLQAPVLPSTLNAGDSLAATLATDVYTAAAGWSAQLRLIGQGANKSIAGTSSAEGWAFPANSAATSDWAAGSYSSIVLLTKGADRISQAGPSIKVLADPAAGGTTTLDLRTDARRALDELQAVYRSYITTNQLLHSYTIGTRTFQFHSITDLIKAIDAAKREVAAEEAAANLAAGRPSSGRIVVRM